MAIYPGAVVKLLPENRTQDDIDPDQAILHSAVDAPGPSSLYGYFARADVTTETHFFIKLDGTVEQYMDTNVQADGNRYANGRAVSIETEDEGNPTERPWTADQLASIVMLLGWLFETHPKIRRRVCPAWNQAGVGFHSMWGAPSPWTPAAGKTCPGKVRIAQFVTIIAPWLEGADDLPYGEIELKNLFRSVLDEGTAEGFLGWSNTNKGQVDLLRAIMVTVGGLNLDNLAQQIADKIPVDEVNKDVVKAALEEVEWATTVRPAA